jgi:hypothetical protein
MISGIMLSGKHMFVNAGYSSMPYVNNSNTSAGMVRYNNNNLEVYDGATWLTISGSVAGVGLNGAAESAIDWAMRKMAEEEAMMALADEYPAVKIALANLEKAKQQLDATIILSKEHDKTTS